MGTNCALITAGIVKLIWCTTFWTLFIQCEVGPSMTESILRQATDCGALTLSYCTKRAPTCSPLCTWVYQYKPIFTTVDQRSPITHAILLYRKTCAMSTWPRHKNGRCSMSWMRVRQQNGKETLSIPWPWTTLQPALVREGVKRGYGNFYWYLPLVTSTTIYT